MGAAHCCVEDHANTVTVEELADLMSGQIFIPARLDENNALISEHTICRTLEVQRRPVASRWDVKPASLVVEFKVLDSGERRTLVFTKKPLGVHFKNEVPLVVNRVDEDSAAEAQGVQIGWEFVSIAGESLEGATFEEVVRRLRIGVIPLQNQVRSGSPTKVDVGPDLPLPVL